MERKTEFLTKAALTSRTPTWARNVFRVTLALTSAATFVLAADTTIEPETVIRIGAYLKALDLVVLGLAHTFGVTIEKQ